ncbi:hypothetical protein D3C78_872220 [compost metagenome]
MQHTVNQPFAQRTARKRHTVNVQLGENGNQDRQAAWENQRALQRQPFDFQLFKATTLDGALFELLQFGKRNSLVHTLRHHNFLQCLNRTRRPDAHFPAVITQFVHNRAQHFARGIFRLIEIFLGKIAIGKIALEPGDASHRQAKQRRRLGTCTGDQLRTCTTNIHNQTTVIAAGGMGDALVNQTRFFFAADHLYRTAQNFLCFCNKINGVDRQA